VPGDEAARTSAASPTQHTQISGVPLSRLPPPASNPPDEPQQSGSLEAFRRYFDVMRISRAAVDWWVGQ